jgi:hypothetical protein
MIPLLNSQRAGFAHYKQNPDQSRGKLIFQNTKLPRLWRDNLVMMDVLTDFIHISKFSKYSEFSKLSP